MGFGENSEKQKANFRKANGKLGKSKRQKTNGKKRFLIFRLACRYKIQPRFSCFFLFALCLS